MIMDVVIREDARPAKMTNDKNSKMAATFLEQAKLACEPRWRGGAAIDHDVAMDAPNTPTR